MGRPYVMRSVPVDPSGGILCVRATPPAQRTVDTLTLQSQLALQAGRFVLRMRGDHGDILSHPLPPGWAYWSHARCMDTEHGELDLGWYTMEGGCWFTNETPDRGLCVLCSMREEAPR